MTIIHDKKYINRKINSVFPGMYFVVFLEENFVDSFGFANG